MQTLSLGPAEWPVPIVRERFVEPDLPHTVRSATPAVPSRHGVH